MLLWLIPFQCQHAQVNRHCILRLTDQVCHPRHRAGHNHVRAQWYHLLARHPGQEIGRRPNLEKGSTHNQVRS